MLFCFVDLMVILYTGGHSTAAETKTKQKKKPKRNDLLNLIDLLQIMSLKHVYYNYNK